MNDGVALDRLRYEPALDGLRALAVGIVIAVHATFLIPGRRELLVPGGWVGVDLFFVLSGYLITRLLADEIDRAGKIDLRRFYIRRSLRLLPAFAALLLIDLVVSTYIFPDTDIYKATLVSIAYIMNWSRAFNWFPQASLGHTWSLSMEEQFYILWPAVFIAIRRRRPLSWLLAMIVGMLIWRSIVALGGADAERTYNGFDTHADTLLIGCAAALLRLDESRREIIRRLSALPITALAVILAVFRYRTLLTQTFGYTLAAIMTAWLILAATQPGRLRDFLSIRPLTYTGKISYGLYLWHYPIIWIGRGHIHGYISILLIPLSYLAAMMSYHYIEKPFLRLKARFEPSERPLADESRTLTHPARRESGLPAGRR
jgi:peptidoglycan/LPS O-acetylase OafA/YrhL